METITYLTSAFINPFLSSLERRRRPENIIAILNLFSVRETSRFNFRREVFDTVTVNWKLLTQNTNNGVKKGVNHSNNKERYCAGNLNDLL